MRTLHWVYKLLKNPVLHALAITILISLIWQNLSVSKPLQDQLRIFQIVQSLFTIVGIIIGGEWAYTAFVRNRNSEPKLNISHEIVCINTNESIYLLKVFAVIENIGQVKVNLTKWTLRAETILPLPSSVKKIAENKTVFLDHDLYWDPVTKKEDERLEGTNFQKILEPSEVDRAIANIVIPKSVEVIQIYSHFSPEHRFNSYGWLMQSVIDFRVFNSPHNGNLEISMPGSKIWYIK